jgi:hypothetical protein
MNLIYYLNNKFKNNTILYETYIIVFSWILFIVNIFILIVIDSQNKKFEGEERPVEHRN